ncbi:FH1/FH2 domain-containing protein 3 isoform X6 [Cherax quadricarinatus]|uniref:FH1/FH2 domain-containing protein 3 isoform X6 n=1 Tax=Cherax quadricarinatus TaxID=27406 RepID=UPI00387E89EB
MSFLGGTCRILEFLADCAEHIFVLGIIYQRMMTGFQQFLVWLGSPQHLAQDIKVQQVCSTINEFALEYRTCRERVLQQTQKKANHRERNKTGGKMIVEGGNSYKEVTSVCSTNGRRTRVLSPDGDVQAFLLASAVRD